MKPIKLFYLVLVFMFILVEGCKKKEPEPPQQAAVEGEKRPVKPIKPTEPTKSLHQATADGDIAQVKLHISRGADVNAKEKAGGYTLLHLAAGNGQQEVAELLLAKGADVNAKDWQGWTPLLRAA